jgi:hypothetical protein
MKKSSQRARRKIPLHKETVALLEAHELRRVVGGGGNDTECDPQCYVPTDPQF